MKIIGHREEQPMTEEPISKSKEIAMLQKDIETLKAFTSSLREMRKDDEERSEKMTGQIGELRNMLFSKEQELKDMNLRVGKAIDLVENAQVERVLVEKKKEDVRIQMLEARIESYRSVSDAIVAELKDMKSKMDLFKGVEQVISLNEEVKRDLTNIKFVKGEIQKHADKIENTFVDFNKKFSEMQSLKIETQQLKEEVLSAIKDVNKFRTEITNMSQKADVYFDKTRGGSALNDNYKRVENMLFDDRRLMKEWVSYFENKIARMENNITLWLENMENKINDLKARLSA